MNFSARLNAFAKGLKGSYGLDIYEKEFIGYFSSLWPDRGDKNSTILVQMPRDYAYLIKFAFFANYYADKYDADIYGYTNWISAQVKGRNFKSTITNSLLHNNYTNNKWLKLYETFGLKLGFANSDPVKGQDIELRSQEIFSALKCKEDVYDIEVCGINCGDLIYDTYLRFRPAVTLDIKCPFLLAVIRSAFEIYYTANAFLDKHNVKCLLNTYSSYLHHGMVMRVCQQRDVDVYTFAFPDYMIMKARPDYARHYRRFFDYKEIFAGLENKEEKLKQAEQLLQNRFSGTIDAATYYMKENPFSSNSEKGERSLADNGKKNVLLMLHCFFDNPNTYRFMLFPDFWEWVETTLNVLRETDFNVYIKAHPNAVPQNLEVIERLKEMYPDMTFVDPKTSNKQLIQEGLAAVITMKGTCGHEFPYFGVPVLNAGDNPHVNYSFCVTPDTREEYIEHLKKIDELPFPEEKERLEEIFEFAYMHNIYREKGKIEEKDVFGIDKYYHIQGTSKFLKEFLQLKVDTEEIKRLVTKACVSCDG